MPSDPGPCASGPRHAVITACTALLLLGAACSEEKDGVEAAQRQVSRAEEAVADAEASLDEAGAAFCEEAQDYIEAIDRYGKIFDDTAATVGDVRTLGEDLGEPRDTTTASAQAVIDAHDALNEANEELFDAEAALVEAKAEASDRPEKKQKTPSPAPTSSPGVPQASVDRVEAAESDLEAASEGITDRTPLDEAKESFTSAAFALEAAWLNLFLDAGCLSDEESSEAHTAIRQYTIALQTDLKAAGYLKAEVDGVYGPQTVAAVEDLQEDAGLPVTGTVDRATRVALDEALAAEGQSAASQAQVETASVQTVLTLAGYWSAPIDGEWTPELEAALKEFQKDLGVEQTGALDAATLAALEEMLVSVEPHAGVSSPSPAS